MDTKLETFVRGLNQQEKQSLRDLLNRDLTANDSKGSDSNSRNFGWANGTIRMTADFDEPLEDFKEYTE